ncbi:hypothetical protein QYE76_014167 [Lolium multiflorum]|uniref:Poly(A) RNA polymerase mitochondrial-like central palm domain-containing protein n=1 Tax=Lolium multiflorum TaxID=4521 RepID=A0AAD8U4F4_LOLMU|nr:hypothetical protein QYE76_014167 [Lolium multiflorum]
MAGFLGSIFVVPASYDRESKREDKVMAREVLTQTLKWSDVEISFSKDDCLENFSEPGRFPIVVNPIIQNYEFTRVFVNGGSAVNLIFTNTLDLMKVPRSAMKPAASYRIYGAIPGSCLPNVGQITLEGLSMTAQSHNYDVLEKCTKDILSAIRPDEKDRNLRLEALHELKDSISSLGALTVEPFGSFLSNLYAKSGDLDVSLELLDDSNFLSTKQTILKKVCEALQTRGGLKSVLQFTSPSLTSAVISTYEGRLKEIQDLPYRMTSHSLFVEDPFERHENAARTVDISEIHRIARAFDHAHSVFARDGLANRNELLSLLCTPEVAIQAGAEGMAT